MKPRPRRRPQPKQAPAVSGLVGRIPPPNPKRVALRISADAERTLRFGHPWLFDQAIRKQSHAGAAGDLAVIYDRRDRFLAIGLYDPDSPIRVRILQRHKQAPIDAGWFTVQIAAAVALREPLRRSAPLTTGYRLVHGENDGLPGLILDRYEDILVLKLYTAAWVPHLPALLEAILTVAPGVRVILRLARVLSQRPKALHGLADGMTLAGSVLDGSVVFWENGLRFEADPIHGHKTGFFLDQRENRAAAGSLSEGKDVLDVFAYTGGFSVYAARGGALTVTSVDTSRPALEAARRNFILNSDDAAVARTRQESIAGDAFEVLLHLRRGERRFGLVIVDPPSFAKSMAEVTAALAAYEKLATLSLGVLRPGGTLLMASCSSHITAEQFFKAVHQAARHAHVPLREIARLGHPLDHPVGFREGAYLKALIATAPKPSGRR